MSDLLNEYSEDFFIESLQEKLRKPEGETIGIGDDCAVVDESRLGITSLKQMLSS